ncbi:MAG: hypothetical protein ABI183_08370 [Polyangiaceae bacterium]
MLLERAISVLAFGSLLGLAIAPSLGCTAGTASSDCALNSCNNGASVKIYANVTADVMSASTVTACLNDGCVSGTPTSLPSSTSARLTIALQGALSVSGYISGPDPVKGYLIEADFDLSTAATANGDIYKLAVVSNGQAVPGQVTQPATYTRSTPNGADCPPTCETVDIEPQ